MAIGVIERSAQRPYSVTTRHLSDSAPIEACDTQCRLGVVKCRLCIAHGAIFFRIPSLTHRLSASRHFSQYNTSIYPCLSVWFAESPRVQRLEFGNLTFFSSRHLAPRYRSGM